MTAQALFRTTAIQEALQPFSAAEALSLWVSSAASFSVCPVSSCKKDSVSWISLVLKPPCTQWVLRPELTHGLTLLVKQKHVFQLSYLPQPICFQ